MYGEAYCFLPVFVLLLGLFVGVALLLNSRRRQRRELNHLLAKQLEKWKKIERKKKHRQSREETRPTDSPGTTTDRQRKRNK